jgi:hypothetical protein
MWRVACVFQKNRRRRLWITFFTYVDKKTSNFFLTYRRVVAVMSVASARVRVTKGKLMYKIVWLCNGVEMTSYVRASEALAFTANKKIISWQPHTYRR